MMVLVTIFLVILSLTSCGASIRSGEQVKREAQIISDLKATNHPTVPPSTYTRDASAELAMELQEADEIPEVDIPKPRVSKAQWIANPEASKEALNTKQKEDGMPATFTAGIAVAATTLFIGLASAMSTMNNPVGTIMGVVSHLTTGQNPKDSKLLTILTDVMEEYKVANPDWKNNPLFKAISEAMPDDIKTHVKNRNV